MNFYHQYPMMRPYVGKSFGVAGTPSLLLVGESHYLDEDSAKRRSPGDWYSGSSANLTDYEVSFISTAKLLADATTNNFPSPTHAIYCNPFWEINEFGPRYSDYRSVADHIAFYNFFLRPAVDGDSLKNDPTFSTDDIEMANEAFRYVCEELKPSAVVFLSGFAFANCNISLPIPVIVTPHPGCAHWNTVRQKYGDKRGRDLLGDFVKTLKWPKTPTSNDENDL